MSTAYICYVILRQIWPRQQQIYIVNIASQLYNLLRQLRGGKKRVASKCLQYTHIIPRSKWEMPPKVDENDQANILLNFQIQRDKLVMANQLDIVVVDK